MSKKPLSAENCDSLRIAPALLRSLPRPASWRRLPAAQQPYESACRNVQRPDAAGPYPRTGLARLDSQLCDAVRHRNLSMQYQPQYEMRSGLGIGIEALARWIRPNGEKVPPSVFIAIAERIGLIAELGEWVLQSACEAVAQWTRSPRERLSTLSVNVSTSQVNPVFCALLERTIERSGLPAERLELEITESTLFADPRLALECLTWWKSLGVRIALDDFGTGYCTLSYLSRLPVDRIKLDQSFTQTLFTNRKSGVIVHAMIELCRDMGIMVLAEGVETEAQFAMLSDYGCLQAQGYLLAPPAPESEARMLLDERWGTRGRPFPAPCLSLEGTSHAC